jgi:ATP-dependent RNA helicase RhlE
MSFSSLGLSPVLCTPLPGLGYTQPTTVQSESIPSVLAGSDVLARAQTGTGKTAAFGLPMIDRLLVRDRRPTAPRRPRGLVLVPTRELALQVHAALATYGVPVRLRVAAIFGGVSMSAQVHALQRRADIVVATPGRLIDHMQQRTVDLAAVEILTLDEADRMLDMGFLPPLRRILAVLPRNRQTLLFSATLSLEVVRLSANFTRDPRRVDVSQAQIVAPMVTHRVHPVSDGRKGDLLKRVLTQPPGGRALVFCKTKRGSDRVGKSLEQAGVKAAVIHGNKSQGARTRALGDFKAGRVTVLVATDIAARGLDIAQLPLVVNYDLPLVAEDYVHRVGRTGRAGLAGHAISLVSTADRGLLHEIQRLLPTPLEEVRVEGFDPAEAAPRVADVDDHRPGSGARFPREAKTGHLQVRGRHAIHRPDARRSGSRANREYPLVPDAVSGLRGKEPMSAYTSSATGSTPRQYQRTRRTTAMRIDRSANTPGCAKWTFRQN